MSEFDDSHPEDVEAGLSKLEENKAHFAAYSRCPAGFDVSREKIVQDA